MTRRPNSDVLTVESPWAARHLLADPDLELTTTEKDHLLTVMRQCWDWTEPPPRT